MLSTIVAVVVRGVQSKIWNCFVRALTIVARSNSASAIPLIMVFIYCFMYDLLGMVVDQEYLSLIQYI